MLAEEEEERKKSAAEGGDASAAADAAVVAGAKVSRAWSFPVSPVVPRPKSPCVFYVCDYQGCMRYYTPWVDFRSSGSPRRRGYRYQMVTFLEISRQDGFNAAIFGTFTAALAE